jgi:hypothetical protein
MNYAKLEGEERERKRETGTRKVCILQKTLAEFGDKTQTMRETSISVAKLFWVRSFTRDIKSMGVCVETSCFVTVKN